MSSSAPAGTSSPRRPRSAPGPISTSNSTTAGSTSPPAAESAASRPRRRRRAGCCEEGMMRPSGRAAEELRAIVLEPGVARHAEGSCLARFGNTHVLCAATVEERVPPWMRNTGRGWVTAEYGMLPRSTHTRSQREAAKGKQTGRTQEIQRLIGRALRAVIDLKALGDRTVTLDCDVLQADGGTRTAAISGGYVALMDAINTLMRKGVIKNNPVH